MADKKLAVVITGNAKGAQAAFGALEKSAGKAGKRTESALSGIGGRLADIGVAAAAWSAFKGFEESQKIARQTEAVIASTGGAANVTAKQVADLANELSKKAGVDDEVIQSGANMLQTFTEISNQAGKNNDIFNQATEATLDLSVAMGKDMRSSAVLVGKALNDPVKGMTALSRAGVQFTAQQKEQITTLSESGRTLEAQKVILKELETQFGGSAEAQATAMGRAQVAVGNLGESIGGILAPAIEGVAGVAGEAAEAFEGLGKGAQQAVVGGAALAYAGLRWGGEIASFAGSAKMAAGNISAFGQLAAEAVRTRPDGVKRTTAALDALSTTAPKATRAMKLFGAGLGVLGVAAIAYELYQFGEALGDIEVDAGKALGATNRELTDISMKLEAVGEARKVYTQTGEQDITALYRWRDALKEAGQSTATIDAVLKEAEGSKKRAAAATNQYAAEVEGLEGAQESATTTAQVWDENNKAVTENIARMEAAQRAATDALKEFYDQQTAMVSSQIAAEASFDAFTESIKEHGRTLDIDTEAGRANKSALYEMRDAAIAAAIEVKNQGGSNTEAANTAKVYAQKLRQTADDAGYTEEEIDVLIATMKLTPKDIETRFHQNSPQEQAKVSNYRAVINGTPTYKRTTFDADTSFAGWKIDQLRAKIAGLGAVNIKPALNLGKGSTKDSAKGGPVYAGQMYRVNEAGDEYFQPAVNGTILTAGQTRKLMNGNIPSAGGGGGGQAIVVNVNVAGSIHATEDVATAVRNALIDRGRRTGKPIFAGLA